MHMSGIPAFGKRQRNTDWRLYFCMGMLEKKELTNLLPLCCLPSASVICTFLWSEWRVLSFNVACVGGVCMCGVCVCVCACVCACVCMHVCMCEHFPECWQTDFLKILNKKMKTSRYIPDSIQYCYIYVTELSRNINGRIK